MTVKAAKTREFTGWHMLAIMVAGFGIMITVNLTLAYNAVATFPGLETRNSYVVSQKFESQSRIRMAIQSSLKSHAPRLAVPHILARTACLTSRGMAPH